jgi:tetratricopeptide (TPR) repeat protein
LAPGYECGQLPTASGVIDKVNQENGKHNLNTFVMQLNNIFNDALACHHAGQSNQAADLYKQILNIDRDHAQASNNLGTIFMSRGRLNDAVSCFQNALNAKADFFEACFNLGRAYKKLGHYSEAIESFRRALVIKEDHVPAYLELSFVCFKLGNTSGAINCCKKALELDPECTDAYNFLGNALVSHGDVPAALESYRRALQIRPDRADIYFNYANALKGSGQLSSAIENYRQALVLKPDYIDAHWNLSHTLLLSGNFFDGWREYEWRFQLPGQKDIYPHRYEVPRWDGASFQGKRLLVHDEQGLGDTLQFMRYLPLVKVLGGTVIFEVRKQLLTLLKNVSGIDELVERSSDGHPPIGFDLYVPLMSLPAIFGTTRETIPAPIPYLSADSDLTRRWAEKLNQISGFKVGICWQGNPSHQADRRRSVPLNFFVQLAKIDKVRLISLQKKHGLEQMADLPAEVSIIDFGSELDESNGVFMDTAAVMQNLDLIIASDTAISHLAGALGVPIWLVLPDIPEWRWLMEQKDSPWYPTMRLFRQMKAGDWASVFYQISEALQMLVNKNS